MREGIRYEILDLNSENIGVFPGLLNANWGTFFQVTPDIFKERIGSGELIIGAYHDNQPVGLLEVVSQRFEESNNNGSKESAIYVSKQFGDYSEMTRGGSFKSRPNNPNTAVFLDLTVAPEFRVKVYKGFPVSVGLVDSAKFLLMDLEARLKQRDYPRYQTLLQLDQEGEFNHLSLINYALTFTPGIPKVIEMHEAQKAFNTGVTIRNARERHPYSDVNPMCYKHPGFIAALGSVKKAA